MTEEESKLLIAACTWLIFGAIGLAIGRSFKGRPLAGFIYGVLLGPLGLVVAAIMGDARRKCPECRSAIPAGATRCRHCRADVPPGAQLRKRVKRPAGYAELPPNFPT